MADDIKTSALTTQSINRIDMEMYLSKVQELPNPDYLFKKSGFDWSVIHSIAPNPRVYACRESVLSKLMEMNWKLEDGNSQDSNKTEFFKDVYSNFNVQKSIEDCANAYFYGFQPLGVDWKVVKNLFYIDKFYSLPQEYFAFDVNNVFKKRKNLYSTSNLEDVNKYRYMYSAYKDSFSNPYGESAYLRCYWDVSFYNEVYKWWIEFCDRFGMPIPEVIFNANTPQNIRDNTVWQVKDCVRGGVFGHDNTYELKTIDFNSPSSTDTFDKLIQRLNDNISIIITGNNLTTEIKGGSLAASGTAENILDSRVQSIARMVETTFNNLNKIIAEVNFGSYDSLPVFKISEDEQVDKTLIERDDLLQKNLALSNLALSKKYYMNNYNLSEDDLEISEKKETISQPINSFSQYDRIQGAIDSQKDIDNLIESISPEDMNKAGEEMVLSIADNINNFSSFEELEYFISTGLRKIKTDILNNTVKKTVFVSDLHGKNSNV